MAHSFAVYAKRPLGDDENVWEHKICCHKSRPKSLEMRREHGNHFESRNQFKQASNILPSLKVLVLKNKQNYFETTKGSKEPVRYLNGATSRPLTWGPNGSNFRDVIALFTDFDGPTIDAAGQGSSLITASRVLDDVTNNNIQIQAKINFSSQNDDALALKRSTNIDCPDTRQENADMEMKLGCNEDISTLFQSENHLCVTTSTVADLPNHFSRVNVDELVEDLVNSMINEIVRSEALRKSQQVFQANEITLKQNLQSKKEVNEAQEVLADVINLVVENDSQLNTLICKTTDESRNHDDGPNTDPTETFQISSRRRSFNESNESNLSEISTNLNESILLAQSQPSVPVCAQSETSSLGSDALEDDQHLNENDVSISSNLIPSPIKEKSKLNESQNLSFESKDIVNEDEFSTLVLDGFDDEEEDCTDDHDDALDAVTVLEVCSTVTNHHITELLYQESNLREAAPSEFNDSVDGIRIEVTILVNELLDDVVESCDKDKCCDLGSNKTTLHQVNHDILEDLTDFTSESSGTKLPGVCSSQTNSNAPTHKVMDMSQEHFELSHENSETCLKAVGGVNELGYLDNTRRVESYDSLSSDDDSFEDRTFVKDDIDDISNDADGEDIDEDDDQKDESFAYPLTETSLFYEDKCDTDEMPETTICQLVTNLNDTETMSEALSPFVEDNSLRRTIESVSDCATTSQRCITSMLKNDHGLASAEVPKNTMDSTATKPSNITDLIVNNSKTTTESLLENEDVIETEGLLEDFSVLLDVETIEDNSNNAFNETVNHEQMSNNTTAESDKEIISEKEIFVPPKRPTTLFTRRSLDNFNALDFFKNISSGSLTPVRDDDGSADVYSEATERVLEEDKTLRRQESFSKPFSSVRYRPKVRPSYLQKLEHLKEHESDDDDDELNDNNEDPSGSTSDTELIFLSTASDVPAPGPTCLCFEKKPASFVMQSKRSRSLPFNIKTDYHDIINFSPLDLSFDDHFRYDTNAATPTAPQFLPYLLNVDEDANKRDSALSRESAASSGTVVATDDEEYEQPENRDILGHLNKAAKYSPSTQSPLTLQDVTDAGRLRRKYKMERSQSLDRQKRNSRRFAKYSNPVSAIHQSNCGMMLSAPSITVTHDCNGVHPNVTPFDPVMSSSQSLASSSSYMGDESDILRSSSIGSSPLSSPSGSPKMPRKSPKTRQKSKILTHRSTKHAERQAAESCEWLKAAGFPQYVQLYEDGNFPVDIASVSSDHDFLKQELIAALVRRLNILNKCANLKLDKTTSKEGFTDNEEEEFEQYALSDFWRFEEDGHRWSRLESKASSIGSPIRSSNSEQKQNIDGLPEDSNGDVFTKEDLLRPVNHDNSGSEGKLNRASFDQPRLVPNKSATLKPKSHSFLKRVGGDLKKIGSFRRKESPRPTVVDISLDDSWAAHPASRNRHKSLRKNRNVTISKPVLQGGHEKFEHMKCTAIDASPTSVRELQNQHRGRKPSSHSLMSSSSSSGGASSISTPASRRTRASTEDFSSDFGELSPGYYNRNRIAAEINQLNNSPLRSKEILQDKDPSLFVMPRDYKPGTFPAALRERYDDDTSSISTPPVSLHSRSHSVSESTQSVAASAPRPMSIYDNLPDNAFSGNVCAHDIIKILDPGSPLRVGNDSDVYMGSMESLDVGRAGIDPAFWSVDDIVEHTQNLQQMVGSWGVGDDDDDEIDDKLPSIDSNLAEPSFPSSDNLPSYNADNVSNIEEDSDTTSLTSSEQRSQLLLRWGPLKREDSDSSTTSDNLQLHTLSAGQLMMLRRLSMLKLTARMEQYTLSNSKGAPLSWSVPRFIRRMKVPDYKDKIVFGVPLLQNVQRSGQPLPICIQHALAHLRRTALDQVGLFRKPGVRGRIHKLRALCELNPEMEVFDDCSDYDIADLIKQYFRELPDPLMTMKMSDTFVGIFLHVPENLQLQTLQIAIMLLPDENREALKTLLYFLADVAANYNENHMNASNLSTCFSPSLFYQQLGNLRLMASTVSPKIKKTQAGKSLGLPGKPDIRAMSENKASNQCLAFMITNVNELFKISEDAMTQCRMSVMQQTEDVLATEVGYKSDHQDEKDYYADIHAYVDRIIRHAVREEQRYNQNRGWQSVPTANGCELACKKMNDGNPLRMWRSQVEVNGADPGQIMDRILNERHLWDSDLVQWKVLQQPDERTQIFQLVRAEMSPHPTRDYCVLRSWRNDINSRGASAIVEVSTGQHPLLGDVRGVILTSRYLIEPTDLPNKCLLTHMCRVDTKGRNPEWYNKAYGHIVSLNLTKIRDSLRNFPPKMSSLIA